MIARTFASGPLTWSVVVVAVVVSGGCRLQVCVVRIQPVVVVVHNHLCRPIRLSDQIGAAKLQLDSYLPVKQRKLKSLEKNKRPVDLRD